MTEPLPSMMMGLAIGGSPFGPYHALSMAVNVYVPLAARLIVSAPGFALASLIALISPATSPSGMLKVVAQPRVSTHVQIAATTRAKVAPFRTEILRRVELGAVIVFIKGGFLLFRIGTELGPPAAPAFEWHYRKNCRRWQRFCVE